MARGTTKIVFIDSNFNAEGYINVLEDVLLPFIEEKYGGDDHWSTFQHDNASRHKTNITLEWLFDTGIKVLPWPAKSPDLNVIENVWAWLVNDVYAGHRRFDSVDDLKECIAYKWELMTAEPLKKLIESMPKRVADVVHADSGATKYWMCMNYPS